MKTVQIEFELTNIEQTTEKVQQLVDLLNEAKAIANSLFGNSDNAAKNFINEVIKHLDEVREVKQNGNRQHI